MASAPSMQDLAALERAHRLLALLQADDVDAAIEAGLAAFVALPGLDAQANATLEDARDRLASAWAARTRHRARALRLARIDHARQRARAARTPGTSDDAAKHDSTATPPPSTPAAPALPPAAAAALARAKARVNGGRP